MSNGRVVDWFAALGAWIGAAVTAAAVLVSADSISQQLSYSERQQTRELLQQSIEAIRARSRDDEVLRCVDNSFRVLSSQDCAAKIFEDRPMIDNALTHASRILEYHNMVARYNDKYCSPNSLSECINQKYSIQRIRKDEFGIFGKVLSDRPFMNFYYDIERNHVNKTGERKHYFEILSNDEIKQGMQRFGAFVPDAIFGTAAERVLVEPTLTDPATVETSPAVVPATIPAPEKK